MRLIPSNPNVHFALILSISDQEIEFGANNVSKYKEVEVLEKFGWGNQKQFFVNIFPADLPPSILFEDLKVGDKLFLEVSCF